MEPAGNVPAIPGLSGSSGSSCVRPQTYIQLVIIRVINVIIRMNIKGYQGYQGYLRRFTAEVGLVFDNTCVGVGQESCTNRVTSGVNNICKH